MNMNNTKSKQNTLPPKRIMVFDFHSKMLIEVIKALQYRSVEILYWTASKKDFTEVFNNKNLFPNTIFHDADDAAAAIPAKEMDTSSFEPVGKDLIKQFRECELQSLIMMESIDRTNVPLIKKVHIYYKYLKYWYGVLTTLKPDAIIFSDVPHMTFKYVAHQIAKRLGIQSVMAREGLISGRMFILGDNLDYKKLREQIGINQGKDFTLDDISPDIRDYYEKQKKTDTSPFYFQVDSIKEAMHGLYQFLPSIRAIKKNIKNGTFLKTAYSYARMLFMKRSVLSLERFIGPTWVLKLQERKWNQIKQEAKREYMRHQKKPDYSKKYIYVPLHRQPERSTSADGGVFVDQLLVIDILSHAIPKDWVIYVKENPLQWVLPRAHVARFKGHTEEIVCNSNVSVVPAETSTFDLIKNAQAVAAVTSTAAWEAVVRGKPALIFGYVWSMYCDGMFRVGDMESCKEAIEKIKDGYVPDQQKVVNFLKAFDQTTILGYRNHRFRRLDNSNITLITSDEENIASITDGFYNELMSEKIRDESQNI